jgi:transcriptional regulator with XRE-family HTH domain
MQTIGERLEEARKRKGISIREAAEATKIRGDYLHKFESNQFDIRLPDIYIRGFLRIYASFLKLPPEKINADYLALGLGEGGRPAGRGLNREIYGKMEISHASAGGASSAKKGNSAGSAQSSSSGPGQEGDAPSPAPQRAPFQPRMPLGGLDRALLSKNGLWIGIGAVVLLALVVWGVVALIGGKSDSVADNPPPAVVEERVYIVALRPVQVTAVKSKTDGRDLASGPLPAALATGDRYPLPNVGMLVSVTSRDAVQIEFKGGRYAASGAGPGTLDLDFSAQR